MLFGFLRPLLAKVCLSQSSLQGSLSGSARSAFSSALRSPCSDYSHRSRAQLTLLHAHLLMHTR